MSDEHLHDLGKLLFAFSTFWMYANIPGETTYFVARARGAYGLPFVLNMGLNWVVPFFTLLRRGPKRRHELIVNVAVVVLVGRWLDLYLMIVPPFSRSGPPFGLWEVAGIGTMAAPRPGP